MLAQSVVRIMVVPQCSYSYTHVLFMTFKNSENSKIIKKIVGFQNFQKIESKILSIRIIRIIRKKSQNQLNRFFGQRINIDCDDDVKDVY